MVRLTGKKIQRPGLSDLELQRLRRSLRRSAPSEAWVDAQIVSFSDRKSDGEWIVYRFHDTRVFPPGGRLNTPMRWCRDCGRYTPAPCVSLVESSRRRSEPPVQATLVCDDCRMAGEAIRFRPIYDALPNLRPTGSFSFVQMHDRAG